jgi:sugar phosphate permease
MTGNTVPKEPAEAAGSFITPAYRFGFVLIISLFFLWAVANNFNDILIRQFQKSLGLDRAQAGFIQFVFYIGYSLSRCRPGSSCGASGTRRASSPACCCMHATRCCSFPPPSCSATAPSCSRYS